MLPPLPDKDNTRYLVDRKLRRYMRGRKTLREAFSDRFGDETAQKDFLDLTKQEQEKYAELVQKQKQNPSGKKLSQSELRMAARALTGLDSDKPPILLTNNRDLQEFVMSQGGKAHTGVATMQQVQNSNPDNELVQLQARTVGHTMHRDRKFGVERRKEDKPTISQQEQLLRHKQRQQQKLREQRRRNRQLMGVPEKLVEKNEKNIKKHESMKQQLESMKGKRGSKTAPKVMLKHSQKTHMRHKPVKHPPTPHKKTPQHPEKSQKPQWVRAKPSKQVMEPKETPKPKSQWVRAKPSKQVMQQKQTPKSPPPKVPEKRQKPSPPPRQVKQQPQYQQPQYQQGTYVVHVQPYMQQQRMHGQQMDQQRYQMMPQMQYQQQFAYQMGPAQYQMMQMMQMVQLMQQMQQMMQQMMRQMQMQRQSMGSMGGW